MTQPRIKLLFFALLGSAAMCHTHSACALPTRQILSRSASSINFGVDSAAPALQMSGKLKDFNGSVSVNPDASIKQVTLALNLSSAQLPPDQLLQGFFLQSVLARFRQPSTTFTSSEITRLDTHHYVAQGSYSWQNKTRLASVPFELVKSSLEGTEIRVRMKGALTDRSTPPEIEAAAPGASNSSGWASAVLVFR